MKVHLPALVLAVLVGIIVVCVTILAAMGSAVPDWFKDLAFLLGGGAAGVATPPSA